MTTLHLTSAGLRVGDVFVAIPGVTPAEIAALLKAEARTTQGQRDHIHTWDAHGIYAYTSKAKPTRVHALAIDLGETAAYAFSPKSVFAGTVMWETESLVPEGDAATALRLAMVKNPSLKKKASRTHRIESLTLGTLSVHCALNEERTALATITISEAPAMEVKLPAMKPPEGAGARFEDFNFKLMVIEELMYRRDVLKPRFDVYAFVKRFDGRTIDIRAEGFAVIPEVRRYFEDFPIPAELLVSIESLVQDGSQIYLQLCPLWEGQDDTFNLRSAADAAMLPNLKKVVLFYEERDAVLKALKERGIAARCLS